MSAQKCVNEPNVPCPAVFESPFLEAAGGLNSRYDNLNEILRGIEELISQGKLIDLRQAGEELADYVARLKPDFVCFSNSLLSGSLPALRQLYSGRVYCVLQGDDVFLDGLIEPYRSEVMKALTKQAAEFDGRSCRQPE